MATSPCPRTLVHRLLDQLQLEVPPAAPGISKSVSPSGRGGDPEPPLYWAACESV